MKNKINSAVSAIRALAALPFGKTAFCNIAEGTHAGSITMTASENVDSQNLVVSAAATEGEFAIAKANSKPVGVCLDEGSKGEIMSVALGGCPESTFVCKTAANVVAGDSLYTAAGGKVSPVASDGSYKIGVALCSAAANCPVEVSPQGFGERAWQVFDCGVFEWSTSTTTATLTLGNLSSGYVAIASIAAAAGSEKTVKTATTSTGLTFTLDANGTSGQTKIAWIVLAKN